MGEGEEGGGGEEGEEVHVGWIDSGDEISWPGEMCSLPIDCGQSAV